jgi:hypothetical protein
MTDVNLNYIDERLDVLEDISNDVNGNIDVLWKRYDKYYMKYYRMNLLTLSLSTLVTFVNALSILTSENFEENNTLDFCWRLISLMLSSVMTLCASIIRFRNYRDKLEKIKESIDKLTIIQTRVNVDKYNRTIDNIPDILHNLGNVEIRI